MRDRSSPSAIAPHQARFLTTFFLDELPDDRFRRVGDFDRPLPEVPASTVPLQAG